VSGWWLVAAAHRFFYQGQLLDGSGVDAMSKGAPFHRQLATRPFVVWDCREGRETSGRETSGQAGGGSLTNVAEARLAAALVAGEPTAAAAVAITAAAAAVRCGYA
jgi:hypothetical protein